MSYTVREIEEMRQVLNSIAWMQASSYNTADLAAQIERELLTHMANGTRPSALNKRLGELQKARLAAWERQQAAWERQQAAMAKRKEEEAERQWEADTKAKRRELGFSDEEGIMLQLRKERKERRDLRP